MAGYVESATLLLKDQSSAKIKKVNAELKSLFATAKQLSNMKINLQGLSKLTTEAKKADAVLKDLTRRTIKPRFDLSSVNSATSRVNALNASLNRAARNRRTSIIAGLSGAHLTGIGRQIGFGFNATIGNALARGASNLVREGVRATLSSEDAQVRLAQAGFNPTEVAGFVEQSRKIQEQFPQVPAAEMLNASVEQLTALKIANASTEDYAAAMQRIARNSQIMAVTFKDASEGAEQARQAERFSQILGEDIDNTAIRKLQDAAMRAVIASGGEMKMAEAVRALQQLGPTIAKSMSPQALTDLILTRDEGGRASTAEWRTAIQDLMRDSLNPDDKQAMAKLGLRRKGGGANKEIVKAASENLVDFVDQTMRPLLAKAGLSDATSAEIGAWLDEFGGFTTSGARAIADLAASLRDGETQRQREAARRVNLDPRVADRTYRGATQALTASFDTAIGRNLDKFAPMFAQEVNPLRQAIDLAGKQAQQGDLTKSANTMANAALDLARGPAGTAVGAIATVEAMKTLITPGTSMLEKGAATLQIAAAGLLAFAKDRGWIEETVRPPQVGTGAGGAVTPADIAARRETTKVLQDAAFDYSAAQLQGVPPQLQPPKTVDQFIREVQARQGIAVDAIIGPDTTAALVKEGEQVKTSFTNVMQFVKDTVQAVKENATAAGVFKPPSERPPPPLPKVGETAPAPTTKPIQVFTNQQLEDLRSAPQRFVEFVKDAWDKAGAQVRTDQETEQIRKMEELLRQDTEKAKGKEGRVFRGEPLPLPVPVIIQDMLREPIPERFDYPPLQEPIPERFGALSPQVLSAIDGMQFASNLEAAGNTLPAKGTEFGTNANAAINASALGTQFGNAAAAQIRNAAANIQVQVHATGGGPDTGHLGGGVGGHAVA